MGRSGDSLVAMRGSLMTTGMSVELAVVDAGGRKLAELAENELSVGRTAAINLGPLAASLLPLLAVGTAAAVNGSEDDESEDTSVGPGRLGAGRPVEASAPANTGGSEGDDSEPSQSSHSMSLRLPITTTAASLPTGQCRASAVLPPRC